MARTYHLWSQFICKVNLTKQCPRDFSRIKKKSLRSIQAYLTLFFSNRYRIFIQKPWNSSLPAFWNRTVICNAVIFWICVLTVGFVISAPFGVVFGVSHNHDILVRKTKEKNDIYSDLSIFMYNGVILYELVNGNLLSVALS